MEGTVQERLCQFHHPLNIANKQDLLGTQIGDLSPNTGGLRELSEKALYKCIANSTL